MTTKVLIQLPLAKEVAGPLGDILRSMGGPWVQDWIDKNKRDRKDTGHPESGTEKASKTQRSSVTKPMSTKVHMPDLEATSTCSSSNLPGVGPETTLPTRFQRAKASVSKRQCVLLPEPLEKIWTDIGQQPSSLKSHTMALSLSEPWGIVFYLDLGFTLVTQAEHRASNSNQ